MLTEIIRIIVVFKDKLRTTNLSKIIPADHEPYFYAKIRRVNMAGQLPMLT